MGKYLALSSRVINTFEFEIKFQADFPTITKFNIFRLFKPIPPKTLCVVKRSQESQCNPLEFPVL